jgi:hypothetical protein
LPGDIDRSSEASDISAFSVSFALLLPTPGDMMSLATAAGAVGIVSTGCATMISSECPRAGILAIGFHQELQQESHVDVVVIIFLVGMSCQNFEV